MRSKVVWQEGMAFDADIDGFAYTLDATPEFGGRDLGPRPKGLVLTALAGCTAMDVIAILAKMRVVPAHFEVEAEAGVRDQHPRVLTDVVVRYRFDGEDLPPAKLRRAVELSEERYCAVSAMLRQAVAIRSEITVNGVALDAAAAA